MSSRKRARLFREVNDRIYELLESAEPDLPGEFLCECGQECERRVLLLPVAFAAMRRAGRDVTSPDCLDQEFQFGQREAPAGGIAVPS
jgi:hypothetical protein